MKKQKTILPLFLITFVLAIVFVSAAADDPTLVTPAASGYVKGTTYNLSATVETPAETANVTFYYNSSGATQHALCNDINATADETSFSCTYDTDTNIADGTYSFYAKSFDDDYATELAQDESATVVTDNTNPTVTFTIPYYHFDTGELMTVDCSATDATAGVANYTITVTKPDATTSSTTDTSAIAGYTFSSGDFGMPGSYTIACVVYDSASNTASSSYDLTVKSETSEIVIQKQIGVGDWIQNNMILVLSALAAVVIIIAVVLTVTSATGKKRRRR